MKREAFKMKHVITFSCLIGAVAAYLAGSASGAVILFVVGVILESVFWLRLFRRKENL